MPVTNPASMSSIKTEFQGPDNFKPYVRNGAHVPTNSTTGSISTTEAGLAMSQFANAQKNVFTTPSFSASPNPRSHYYLGTTASQSLSASIALSPSGGDGSYTYAVNNLAGTGSYSSPTWSISGNTLWLGLTLSGVTAGGAKSATLAIDVTVVSNGVSGNTIRCQVNFTYEREGGGSCVVVRSVVVKALGTVNAAGELEVGDELLVTEPSLDIALNTVQGEVLKSEVHTVDCMRIVTESGAWLECSTTAPIPTVNGYVLAPDLKGQRIPVAKLEQIQADHTDFVWEEVVDVIDIGADQVQLLYVADRCFWASGDGEHFILHHNSKIIL